MSYTDEVTKSNKVHNNLYTYKRGADHGYLTVVCKKHGEFTQNRSNHFKGHGCSKCSCFDSKGESELFDYIASKYKGLIIREDRQVLKSYVGMDTGTEIDVFLPELNLGFEFNGYMYHNATHPTFRKHRKYHNNKFKACKKEGVTLVSVWDFMYFENKQKYKNLINRKLNLTEVIGGRKTVKTKISAKEAFKFYAEHHFEGSVNKVYYKDTINLGLFYKGEMVMCASYSDKEVHRICTLPNYCVMGGVSKLMKDVKAGCVFFSVNDMGASTSFIGFKQVSYTSSRYWWVKSSEHLSRYQTQKSKIVKRFGIDMEGHTEVSAMTQLGYYQCFDSGLTKFVKV